MKEIIKKYFTVGILNIISLIILTVLLILHKEEPVLVVGNFLCCFIILFGIISIIKYYKQKDKTDKIDLHYGIGAILLGGVLLLNRGGYLLSSFFLIICFVFKIELSSFINFLVGIIVIITGFRKLYYSNLLKKGSNKHWKIMIALSIGSLILGVLLMTIPLKSIINPLLLIAILIVLELLIDISLTIFINNYNKTKKTKESK